MTGPVPRREESLARPRSRKGTAEAKPITKGTMRPVSHIEPDEQWHPIARMIWDALWTSGQADYYQDSDYALAYSICDDLSHFKSSGKRSSMMAGVIYSALTALLLSEGDRRRARIELTAPVVEETPAAVLAIADYRKDLGVA